MEKRPKVATPFSVSPEERSALMQNDLKMMLDDPEHNTWAKVYATGMPVFVMISVMSTLLQTIQTSDGRSFSGVGAAVIEVTAEMVFFIDFVIRLSVCQHKLCFFANFHNFIDFLAAVPLIIRLKLGCVLSEHEMETLPGSMLLYIVPMVRLMKTLRGFKCFNLILGTVLKVYCETWPTMLVLVYVVLFFSTLIYYVEPRDNIGSYPQAMWFVIVTMTTVGYGDVSPSTSLGYVVAGVLVCSTMFVMALPLGIIGTAVSEIWNERHTILLRTWARERLAQWGYTARDIPKFFAAFDTDCSGELDFNEFCAMLDEMKVGIKEEKRRELFNSFDGDRSGTIDGEEFVTKLYPKEKRAILFGEEEVKKMDFKEKCKNAFQRRFQPCGCKKTPPKSLQPYVYENEPDNGDVAQVPTPLNSPPTPNRVTPFD